MKKLALAILLACSAVAVAQPQPKKQRQHEVLRERPSGFWTSNKPAVGGAYRWRLLGLGIAITGIMGIVVLRVMRTPRSAQKR